MKEVGKKRVKNKEINLEINNRAQVTIFIILGILIIAAIAAFFTFKLGNVNTQFIDGNVDPVARPVYNFVTECVRKVGDDAIYQIGKTGGYVIPPQPKMKFEDILNDDGIAFYLYDSGYKIESNDNLGSIAPAPGIPAPSDTNEVIVKENYIPSKEKIQDELSKYMDSFIYFCTSDFKQFPSFNVSSGEAKTSTKIENGKVIFDVDYPLQISKGNKVYSIKKFEAIVTVRLNEVYSLTSDIMEEQMEKPDAICMSCINDISTKYDMKVKMMDSEEGIVFVVLDEKSKINNKDYLFYFANKYD